MNILISDSNVPSINATPSDMPRLKKMIYLGYTLSEAKTTKNGNSNKTVTRLKKIVQYYKPVQGPSNAGPTPLQVPESSI